MDFSRWPPPARIENFSSFGFTGLLVTSRPRSRGCFASSMFSTVWNSPRVTDWRKDFSDGSLSGNRGPPKKGVGLDKLLERRVSFPTLSTSLLEKWALRPAFFFPSTNPPYEQRNSFRL